MFTKTKTFVGFVLLSFAFGTTHASTVTWDFSGGSWWGNNLGSGVVDFYATDGVSKLEAEAFRRNNDPVSWDSANAQINQNLFGLGVKSSRRDGGQLDNRGHYELIRLSLGTGLFPSSSTLTLTFTSDDFTIWGNDDGDLPDVVDLDPLNGVVIKNDRGAGLATTIDLATTRAFNYLFFATSVDLTDPANDDYRLKSLTLSQNPHVSAVPLPASVWLFGSVVIGAGVLVRRRRDA